MKRHRRASSPAYAVTIAALAAMACGAQKETPQVIAGDSAVPSVAADSIVAPSRAAPTTQCGATIMSGRGIGALRIGLAIDSVRASCSVLSDTTRLASEGQLARFIVVAFERDTLEAEIVNGRVWRIEVLSPRFRTADSLGVGTPLSRLLALRNPRGLTGEGQLFVASSEQCGLSFRLSDNGSSARSQDWDRAALSRLPARTVVDKVLIVGCDPR